MIRAVVDTSVLVSALIGSADAAPARLVQAWRDGRVTFVASPRLIEELEGVLARPKFERWAGDGRGVAYAAAVAAGSEWHQDLDSEPATRDPGDDYLVALARAAGADVLVSVDRDLLEADVTDVRCVLPSVALKYVSD